MFSSAGVDLPEEIAFLQSALRAELPASEIVVCSDAVVALASGTGGVLHGCVVLADVNTVAFGILNGQTQARAGGWGPMFMDGGR